MRFFPEIHPVANSPIPDSDYAIFSWRQQSYQVGSPESDTDDMTAVPAIAIGEPGPSKLPASSAAVAAGPTPTLHLHNPAQPLPVPPAYRNPSYYIFRPTPIPKVSPPSSAGRSSRRSSRKKDREDEANDGVPKLMKQFEKFHNENGVRTVMGSIGPVKNGERISGVRWTGRRLTFTRSQDAPESRIPPCLHFSEIRAEARVRATRCYTRKLWVWRSGEHWHMANYASDLIFV